MTSPFFVVLKHWLIVTLLLLTFLGIIQQAIWEPWFGLVGGVGAKAGARVDRSIGSSIRGGNSHLRKWMLGFKVNRECFELM